MVDFIGNAQLWLEGVRRDHLSTLRELEYVRRNGTRVDLTGCGVTIGQYDRTLDLVSEVAINVQSRDYIIPECCLDFEPHAGDEIRERMPDDKIKTMRIVPYSGDADWEWHDREETSYRVHANYVGIA